MNYSSNDKDTMTFIRLLRESHGEKFSNSFQEEVSKMSQAIY